MGLHEMDSTSEARRKAFLDKVEARFRRIL
jgi:hypothetical protein